MEQYRKSPRARHIDYNDGVFFVTGVTLGRRHFFGVIYDEIMHCSDIGKILECELSNPNIHHSHIEIPQFVVMPNHFHAIVIVKSDEGKNLPESRDDRCLQGYKEAINAGNCNSSTVPLLGRYLGSMKSAVARMARLHNPIFGWQGRFHDHAIRNTAEANMINEYIETNVVKWDIDCFNNKNKRLREEV